MRGSETDLEREERTARLLRQPVRDPLVPPFAQVEARVARRSSEGLLVLALVAVVMFAFVVGSVLAQRHAVVAEPTPTTNSTASSSSLSWQQKLIADTQVGEPRAFVPLLPTYMPGNPSVEVTSLASCGASSSSCLSYRFQAGSERILDVLEGPAGCCLDGVRKNAIRDVDIRPGLRGVYEPVAAQFAGPILWWDEDTGRGPAYVALSSPVLSEDELVRIANSMRPLPPSPTSTVPTAPPQPAAALARPQPQSPVTPVVVTALREAGAILGIRASGGTYTYDGQTGTLSFFPAARARTEHVAPQGSLVAVEHLAQTSSQSTVLTPKELAIRDGGIERVVYRAPQNADSSFYWSGWSPDARYLAVWEIDHVSGSIDMDGRPLVVIDVQTGARTDLGRTLLSGTTAWTAPHKLAYVAGIGRLPWDTKTLRLWSPERGVQDLTPPSVAAFGPAWSSDGRSIYFVSGPAGNWDPLAAAAGNGVGDRHVTIYDASTGSTRSLPNGPGYVVEGVRPSRDSSHLLVLRRHIAVARDVASIPPVDVDIALTDMSGSSAAVLVRFPGYGLNAYGYLNGPAEWLWTE
jgi:WD40 repeat protein